MTISFVSAHRRRASSAVAFQFFRASKIYDVLSKRTPRVCCICPCICPCTRYEYSGGVFGPRSHPRLCLRLPVCLYSVLAPIPVCAYVCLSVCYRPRGDGFFFEVFVRPAARSIPSLLPGIKQALSPVLLVFRSPSLRDPDCATKRTKTYSSSARAVLVTRGEHPIRSRPKHVPPRSGRVQ